MSSNDSEKAIIEVSGRWTTEKGVRIQLSCIGGSSPSHVQFMFGRIGPGLYMRSLMLACTKDGDALFEGYSYPAMWSVTYGFLPQEHKRLGWSEIPASPSFPSLQIRNEFDSVVDRVLRLMKKFYEKNPQGCSAIDYVADNLLLEMLSQRIDGCSPATKANYNFARTAKCVDAVAK